MNDTAFLAGVEGISTDLAALIQRKLAPIADQYGYGEALKQHPSGKPLILMVGADASGRSAALEELVGRNVPRAADSFVVVTGSTYHNHELDPSSTYHNPELGSGGGGTDPFGLLKRHGDDLARHFQMVNLPVVWLDAVAIVDAPGLPGPQPPYDYYEVLGDLASIADLILVFVDCTKANTTQEIYTQLRRGIPEKAFAERVIWVLSRADECADLRALLDHHADMVWNLARISGNDDVPSILVHHTSSFAKTGGNADRRSFLRLLEIQKDEFKTLILKAPFHRLDHRLSFAERHARSLRHILEALLSYAHKRMVFKIKMSLLGIVGGIFVGLFLTSYIQMMKPFGVWSLQEASWASFGTSILLYIAYQIAINRFVLPSYLARLLNNLDQLTNLDDQTRRDTWEDVRSIVHNVLRARNLVISRRTLRGEVRALDALLNVDFPALRARIRSHIASSKDQL